MKKKKHSFLRFLLIAAILLIAIVFLIGFLGDDEEYDDTSADAYGSYEEYDSDDGYGDYDEKDYDEYDDSEEYDSEDEYDDSEEYEEEDYEESSHVSGTPANSGSFRSHYVDTAAAKSATMMVYIIGSDLESDGGSATEDLNEMLSADFGNNLKIAVQTGGASYWNTEEISTDTRERWILDDSGMNYDSDAGKGSMTEPSAVTSFIKWAVAACPADRYMLVFWDHGGGTVGGYGSDEVYEDDALSLKDLADAIGASGVKFDLIGYDACLMATVENAYAMEPYADYLLASEEYEPGSGWYYTDFLSALARDPSMDTVKFGKKVIDDFHDFYGGEEVTLSLVDLAEIPDVYENLADFLSAAETTIQNDNAEYKTLSKAISKARTYCDGEIDQIDMVDMINRTDFDGKEELKNSVLSAVKYHNDSSLTGSNGLAMYFPYQAADSYESTRKLLNGIGFSSPTDSYNYFMSIRANGQNRNGTQRSGMRSAKNKDYTKEDWYEEKAADSFEYEEEPEELVLKESKDGYVLKQPDSFWDDITDIRLNVFVDYKDGYADLGADNAESWTDDGQLLLDFDYQWVSINDRIVPFYALDSEENAEGAVIYSGLVYAVLNGDTDIELYLEWEPQDGNVEEPKAIVKGYRVLDEKSSTYAKGLKTLKKGDKLEFLFDFYPDDDSDPEEMYFGEPITVTSQEALKVGYTEMEDCTVICWYTLVDIYGKELETETIEISLE